MKIKLPKTFADLSISEWELLHQNEDNMDALVALSGIKKEDIQKLSKKGLDVAYAHIEELRKSEYGELVEKLNINGVQYGFVNDWDSFSMGEWIDMENYCKDVSKNAKNILSLLYREIVREEGKRYWIKDYTAKEDPEKFKDIPATVFGGVLSFFLNTKIELLRTMRLSLAGILREVSLGNDGVGIPHYIPSQVKTFLKWMQLPKNLWQRFLRIFVTYKT